MKRRCEVRSVLYDRGVILALAIFSLFARPAAEPLPAARIQAAAAFSAAHGGHALLILQNGNILHESYSSGHSRREHHRIYSGTKAFWCLTALAAEKDGILNLNERVSDTITEWQKERAKTKITIRQLLDFSSGIEPIFALHENNYKDRTSSALKATVVGMPGKSFIYGPASLQVYLEVLARKLRAKHQTPTRYLERRVLSPLGLGAQRYLPDAKGAPLLASGFMQTARQWATLGTWVLKHEELAAPRLTSSANQAYGFGFWNNRAVNATNAREVDVEDMLDRKWSKQFWRGACLCRDAPKDLIACIGSYGQRLYIIPSRQLIIVRMAQDASPDDARFLRLLFAKEKA